METNLGDLGTFEEVSHEQTQLEVHDQQAAALDWLKERMRREPKEEIDAMQELEELLSRIDRPVEKVARKFSKITRDESGSRILHLAVPRVNKDKNWITPNEYEITEVDLGKSSKAQMVEDFDESSLALKEQMKRMEEKNKRLKSENKALCKYVQCLRHPSKKKIRPLFLPLLFPRNLLMALKKQEELSVLKNRWRTPSLQLVNLLKTWLTSTCES